MTEQTSADIAKALERVDAARREIGRVEENLIDRVDTLAEAVTEGFKETNLALALLTQEIAALKVENAKRSGSERAFKWMFGIILAIALSLAGIVYNVHTPTHQQH